MVNSRKRDNSSERNIQNSTFKVKSHVLFDYLATQGTQPTYDEDGDLKFVKDKTLFYLVFDAKDDAFCQLVLPGVELFHNDEEAQKAIELASRIARRVKTVKAFLQEKKALCFAADFYSSNYDELTTRLERACEACRLTRSFYVSERLLAFEKRIESNLERREHSQKKTTETEIFY